MENVSSEAWAVRATAWELAAFSFRHPTRELAEAVASGEWVAAACEVCDALGAELPEGFGDGVGLSQKGGDDSAGLASGSGDSEVTDCLFHALRAEATRLFVGPGEPACSPYEGVWRAKADGVKPLLFVNPHSMEVERFVKACGFARPEGTNNPLDYIATECELLEALALRAASELHTSSECDPTDSELPGGSAAAAYDRFIEEHLKTWVVDFCTACASQAREPFYRAASQYLFRIAQCSQL